MGKLDYNKKVIYFKIFIIILSLSIFLEIYNYKRIKSINNNNIYKNNRNIIFKLEKVNYKISLYFSIYN